MSNNNEAAKKYLTAHGFYLGGNRKHEVERWMSDFAEQRSMAFQDWWYLNYWEIESIDGLHEPVYKNLKTDLRKTHAELWLMFLEYERGTA